MKKLALLLSALLVAAGPSFAGDEKAKSDKAGKTHAVEAEVVSVDTTANTLTIKGDPNKTVTVDTMAAESLKGLKAGDKVKLTCSDSAAGAHEKVTKIEKKTN
jgi:ABC-type enterochelin transport system substrate-binding protein